MGRTHRPPAGQHRHCEKCFSKRCQAPINTGVSCLMISCRSHCEATFHMCKEEEHRLLCPNEWVPCLNSVFGCPFSMFRFKLAKHLKVCPASVVCCSMEWNRWPSIDSGTKLLENVMKEEHREDCLDVALALRDQNIVFNSLNMAELFPELSEHPKNTITPELDLDMEEVGAVGGTDYAGNTETNNGEEVELTQYEREALAKGKDGVDLAKFSQWEAMFSKEKTAAQVLEKNTKQSEKNSSDKSKKSDITPTLDEKNEISQEENTEASVKGNTEVTGLAPWNEGVLERLKSEVDCGSYNMYLVHHGSMLVRFGQMPACTPKDKDFVYGKLEAQTVKTVCTFKVPTSYCGRRAKLGEDAPKKEKAEKIVDTSDLGVQISDLPLSDTINTTLLCALEREFMGRAVSQSKAVDGLLIDFGTQTYDFGMDAFSKKVVLADILHEIPLKLCLQNECVTNRHNKSNSAFSFSCNLFFRRDEFPSHFKNVHSDIHSCLNGWFQERCPLSYLGCTFVRNRFRPAGQKAQVIYSKQLKTFAVKPHVACTLYEGVKPNLYRSNRGKSKDSLSTLPLEVLQHIAGFLDSFSLCQLSQVSTLMRDVCAILLQERGMVHLLWEKKTYSHGGTSWRCRKKVWNFSSLFSNVHQWVFEDGPSMSGHLTICPFNNIEYKKEPFKLPSQYEPKKEVKQNLVTFHKKL
ncbi:F-box only protein 40 [Bombina bombina]|uniref:F-box only protein 40 n=1 Tax=Bombina bombina TaxID=8345 RepID=UPI00235B006E|nr:F-box only protein 40 [Bombina bombina]